MGWEKRKDGKTRKSRSKEKVVGFSSAFLFPEENERQSLRVEPWKNPTRRRTQGADIVKG